MTDASQAAPFQTHKARLEFLDALRGLAAMYVLVYHMLLLPQPNLVPPRWVETFAMNGGMGVTLFFMVSAFSLYLTMPLRLGESSPTRAFFLHRFFRIAPLFYFVIVVTLIRDLWKFGVTHSAADIASSATFVFNLIPGKQESFVWAGWTVGVEMIFYAIFPLIYARVKSLGSSVALFFATLMLWMAAKLVLDYLIVPEAWKQSILQWNVLKHLPIFAVGIVVYQAFQRLHATNPSPVAFRGLGNGLLWGGIFGIAALLQGWLPNVFGDGYYWQGVVFGCLFMGLALSPWRLLVNATTRYLGKVSYSVYLLHTTVIFFLSPWYSWIYGHSWSLTVCFLLSLMLTLAIVLPLSSLTYRFIELPGISTGKKVARKLRERCTKYVVGDGA